MSEFHPRRNALTDASSGVTSRAIQVHGERVRARRSEVPFDKIDDKVVAETIADFIGIGVGFNEEIVARGLGYRGRNVDALVILKIGSILEEMGERIERLGGLPELPASDNLPASSGVERRKRARKPGLTHEEIYDHVYIAMDLEKLFAPLRPARKRLIPPR